MNKRLWSPDTEYGMVLAFLMALFLGAFWYVVAVDLNWMSFGMLAIAGLLIWYVEKQLRDERRLELIVNNFLIRSGSINMIYDAAPVFDLDTRTIHAVEINGKEYVLKGKHKGYSIGQAYLDDRLKVWVINPAGGPGEKIVVIGYLEKVDAFVN